MGLRESRVKIDPSSVLEVDQDRDIDLSFEEVPGPVQDHSCDVSHLLPSSLSHVLRASIVSISPVII